MFAARRGLEGVLQGRFVQGMSQTPGGTSVLQEPAQTTAPFRSQIQIRGESREFRLLEASDAAPHHGRYGGRPIASAPVPRVDWESSGSSGLRTQARARAR